MAADDLVDLIGQKDLRILERQALEKLTRMATNAAAVNLTFGFRWHASEAAADGRAGIVASTFEELFEMTGQSAKEQLQRCQC